MFREGIREREKTLSRWLKVDVEQNEWDALISGVWNSHSAMKPVIQWINMGDKLEAMATLQNINRSLNLKTGKKEFNRGLNRRRTREIEVFMKNDYGTRETVKLWRGLPVGDPEIVAMPQEAYT